MILDKGICCIYEVKNIAEPGSMPKSDLVLKHQSWYGELNFETAPVSIAMQEGVEISARIRIFQNKSISNHDIVILSDNNTLQYEIIRAYHGVDEDNGELITDLTLKKVVTDYDFT